MAHFLKKNFCNLFYDQIAVNNGIFQIYVES